jgi:hypothetical protein
MACISALATENLCQTSYSVVIFATVIEDTARILILRSMLIYFVDQDLNADALSLTRHAIVGARL